jgi:predicted enzyme related to lactoylglutathione lyase
MAGSMTWFEMGVPDVAKAQQFYGTLLGWTFEPMGSGAVIHTPGGSAGLHGAGLTDRIGAGGPGPPTRHLGGCRCG